MNATSIGKVLILTAGMLVWLAGCTSDTSTSTYGGGGGGGGNPPPNTVVMSNSLFSPANLTVTRGTTVTWMNKDAITHTSTGNTGLWNTGDIAGGTSKTTMFDTVGTFPYYCVYHRSMGMTGSITVR
jgi:plastocyanin